MIRLNDFIFPAYFCFCVTGSKFIESSCHSRTIANRIAAFTVTCPPCLQLFRFRERNVAVSRFIVIFVFLREGGCL